MCKGGAGTSYQLKNVTPAQAGVFRTPLRAEEVLAFASMTERWREYGVQLNSKTERNSDFF